jgi:hypothetical protein
MEFVMPHSPPRRTAPKPGHTTPQVVHTNVLEKIHTDSMGLERLIFFSDAVFAIAITLLALDIRLPTDAATLSNSELIQRLLELGPQYRRLASPCLTMILPSTRGC